MARTTTIRLSDRIEQIRSEELPPRRERKQEIKEAAAEYDNAWLIPDELEEKYERIKDEIASLEGEASTLEHYTEKWGDDEFTIRELSVGSVSAIQDDVAEASDVNMDGEGTPKGGYARKRTLEMGLKEKPAQAPAVENFPDPVGDLLFDLVDEFNTTGEISLGNSSLKIEMMNSEN